MRRRQFATSLSCRHCGIVGKRIFEQFKDREILDRLAAYIELEWIACATEKCRNFFTKMHALSRCPVCKLWSVKLTADHELQQWDCLNHECGWSIALPRIE
ncbi:hypothetical protein KGO95_00450 [Patescibacteria group bacterium]|nr:hypothetical protein [Patescibacteria group bacterium]